MRTLVFVLPVVIAIVFTFYVREAHHAHAVRLVKNGMSRAEVLDLCGPPQEKSGGNDWTYDIWWGQGWANVCFDDNDRVFGTDIESPFDGL
ncbi:hypothetical protein [Aeoliella sp.]|uniref:hypothetical protein n=1 Tax=Aeoliella sp. TaxID=2795800 RepID=UPI003CCBAFB0